jgi:DNA mismatch repair protein MutS2
MPGDNVLVSFFGKLRPGIVVEVRGNMAKVIVKNMTMTVDADSLQVIEVNPEEFLKEEQGVNVDYDVEQVPMKLDLHGKRVEEALELLERYLDRALASGYHFVYVVHGRGTGALRSAIHMMLSKDPRVASFRPASPDEGGEGITIVYLAGG